MAVIASEAQDGKIHAYPGRAAVIGWIFFDWAAQPYFTLITTFVFAPYFAGFVAPDPATGQALWGFATAAADVAGAGIGDGERKAGGDRGVDRVAAPPQDVGADLRRDPLLRHHHAVLGDYGADCRKIGRRVSAALLGKRRRAAGQHKDEGSRYSAPPN